MSDNNYHTGFEVYKAYLALKSHFNQSDYDYIKYNGNVSASIDSFKRRKDRWHFEKISKKYGSRSFEFLLSNLIEDKKFWAGRAMDKKYDQIFNSWMGYIEADLYHFEADMNTINEYCEAEGCGFNDIFLVVPGKHPIIFKLYKKSHIHFYTICYLAKMTGFHIELDKVNSFDPVWKEESNKIHKTIPFCNIKDEYGEIVNKIFAT